MAFGAVDISVLVFGGVYIICAWLSVAIYQTQLKKKKDELFRNMDEEKPESDPGVVSSGPPSKPGPSIVTSGPDSEPSDKQNVPSYQDEDMQTGSEFPSIKVSTKSDPDKDDYPSPSSTTTGQTESKPSQDSDVSGFWGSGQPPPETKSYSTSSTGDTNSLESNNSDVSGFWSSKGSGPGAPPGGDKPDSLTDSSSGNTLSNPSENSQVSGFWDSSKSKSAGGDQKAKKPAGGGGGGGGGGGQKAPSKNDKQSQDSEFWADDDENGAAKGDDLDDYQTFDDTSNISADKTVEVKTK